MFKNYSRTTFKFLPFEFALIFVGPKQTYFELGQALISSVYLSMLPITNHFACLTKMTLPQGEAKKQAWGYFGLCKLKLKFIKEALIRISFLKDD